MNDHARPQTPNAQARARLKLSTLFTREEMSQLTDRSDLRGLWAIASSWAIVGGAMALLARWPHPWAWLIALPLIAGRQLALGILQHEGSHGTLFKTRWMNTLLADWLCARPVWQHLSKYREHHLGHHARTGLASDPDISLHQDYPVSRASLARKLLRDACGMTGLKIMLGLVLMDAGVYKWTVANHLEKLPQAGRRWWDYPLSFLRNAAGMLITNLALWAALALTGHAWLYGAWVLAFITPLPLFVRIRSIAEHGCLERVDDMFRNTRTTRAGWLSRLTVAPVHVNFHLEHHAMAAVPYYRLPRMHQMLLNKGIVSEPPTYLTVLRAASTPTSA